ncbi:unnamed protein product [Mytilus coruscus]|uniref:Uncharacterized protein n=1 Tax=Mytilus coruscus TaxID=42192 RepID=A0A6J8A158_MYTCO|nr:unnamed protein product [Mytilus coruscus]
MRWILKSPGWIYLVLTWVCVYGVTTTKGSTIATTESVTSASKIVTSASQNTPITVTSTTINQTLTSSNATANYTTNDTTTVSNQIVTNSTITSTDTNTVTMDTTASTMPYNTTTETTIEVTTPVNSTINVNDNMTAVINATTTYMHDNVTTFINSTTTQIITSSSNDTAVDKMFDQKAFPSEIAIIAGAVSGVLVIFVVIIAIIKFKKRSNRSLGKRYEVKSRAFTESVAFSDNRESKMSNNDLQRISDGNQNYHMIDEEIFLSNRKDNDRSKDLTDREQKCDAEKVENGSRTSDSGIDVNLDEKNFKPKTSAKFEGDDKPYIKRDGDVEHVYTKSVKRAEITENDNSYAVDTESKDKSKLNSENREVNKTNESDKTNGDEEIEDDEEVYINAYSASSSDTTKAVNNVEIENKHKLEQHPGNLEIKESNESEKTNGDEYLEDDDEVYVNAYSASSSDSIKAVNNETCIESLRSAVAKTDNDDVYDFAVPIDDDEKVEEKTKNESEISHVNNINIEADDHYEVSKETPNKLETVSEDAIYYNEQEDVDDVIYHNNEMDNNKTSQENLDDDTYDCAMSTISHENNSDDIYDSTKESNYDVTQHASEKKRFFIRPSTDDNYDHCELPTEREDYDLVELPENC